VHVSRTLLLGCLLIATLAGLGCGPRDPAVADALRLRIDATPPPATASYRLVIDPRVSYVPDPLDAHERDLVRRSAHAVAATHGWRPAAGEPDWWLVVYREEPERTRAAGSPVRVDVELPDRDFSYHYAFPTAADSALHRRGTLVVDLVPAAESRPVRQAVDLAFFNRRWYADDQPGSGGDCRGVFRLLLVAR